MNSVAHAITERPSSSRTRHNPDPELKQLVASAYSVLEQPPPPTLREILGAYRAKGDGDREMLLAMLSAKSAEDQRLASLAALQRSVLEACQCSPSPNTQPSPPPPPRMSGNHHYPTPSFTQSPHPCDQKSRRVYHQPRHHRLPSRSQSPPRIRHAHTHLPSMRDAPMSYNEPSRKRHRSSMSPPSPHLSFYESHSGSQHEQLPPSPYSSSERSDSAEYSPRSRASMAIGSLLSSGPNHESNGDDL